MRESTFQAAMNYPVKFTHSRSHPLKLAITVFECFPKVDAQDPARNSLEILVTLENGGTRRYTRGNCAVFQVRVEPRGH